MAKDNTRIWPFNGYAPGKYMNTCSVCKEQMTGVDKLCFVCLPCAIKSANELFDYSELGELEYPTLEQMGGGKTWDEMNEAEQANYTLHKVLNALLVSRNTVKRLRKQLSTPTAIPSSIVRALEKMNPWKEVGTYADRHAGFKDCCNVIANLSGDLSAKLMELLSAQPDIISAYKKVCEIAGVPKILIDHPELLSSKPPTPEAIAWAERSIKEYEQSAAQPAEQEEGVELIRKERIRQIQKEGWDKFHDEHHGNMELTGAACCYASSAINKYFKENKVRFEIHLPAETSMEAGNTGDRGDRRLRPAGWFDGWPWDKESDKREKHDILRSLVIAGALIASEIDRLTTSPADKKEDKS